MAQVWDLCQVQQQLFSLTNYCKPCKNTFYDVPPFPIFDIDYLSREIHKLVHPLSFGRFIISSDKNAWFRTAQIGGFRISCWAVFSVTPTMRWIVCKLCRGKAWCKAVNYQVFWHYKGRVPAFNLTAVRPLGKVQWRSKQSEVQGGCRPRLPVVVTRIYHRCLSSTRRI